MARFLFPVLFFCAGTALAASPGPLTESVEFDTTDLTQVAVENTSGKVLISSTDGAKAIVQTTKNKFSENCKLTVEKTGKVLTTNVGRAKLFSTETCDVDVEVKLPKALQKKALSLAVQVGSGAVTIRDVFAELEFKIGSGSLTAEGSFPKIDALTGSGNVSVKGLTGGGDVKTGSGDVALQFAKAAMKGELDLKVGSGNAVLLFPKGMKLKSHFKAASGDLTNEIGDTPKADFKIFMTAGSGDLQIKAY